MIFHVKNKKNLINDERNMSQRYYKTFIINGVRTKRSNGLKF